jgi:hypothetical protein
MIINTLPIKNNRVSKPNKTRCVIVKSLLSRINLKKEIVLLFVTSPILDSSRQITNVAS